MSLVAQASLSEDVIARAAEYLRVHCGCESMQIEAAPALDFETASPNALPTGQTSATLRNRRIAIPFPRREMPGRILFQFAADATPLPRELLEALVGCLSMRLADERACRRAERAEQTAARRLREVAAQYDLGLALAPVPNGPHLQMIVERTALLMEAQACSILLLDPEQKRLQVSASHGLPPDVRAQTQLLGEGIAGRVAQTEQPLLISRTLARDPRLDGIALRPDLGSAMLMPLKDQEQRILGVLCLRRRPDKPEFSIEEMSLCAVFATHAALALVNARLVEDLDRRASTLLKLSTLSRSLLSTTDLDALLRAAVDDVVQVVGLSRCCLYLRDNNRSHFLPRYLHGYSESLARNPVKIGEGAVGWAARSKTVLHYDSSHAVAPEQTPAHPYRQMKGFARSLGTDAYVVIPILTSKDTCIGVLVADNKLQRAPLSAEQIRLLQAFVSQAGIAIENALLYEQMQESVANLRRLNDYTDNVLQSIESAILTTDSRGCIVRCNRAAEEILQKRAKNLRDVTLEDALANLHLPDDEGLALLSLVRRVQDTGERVHRHKVTLHPDGRSALTLYMMVSRLPDHKPTRGGTGIERQGVVIIFEDVTQEVRLEAELEKMRRLADIGQLAAKMAHEVRNALSPIKGAAQIIRGEMVKEWEEGKAEKENGKGKTEKEEDQAGNSASLQLSSAFSAEWPDMIIAEVDSLSRLTSEMLDFARPMPPHLRPLDINAFLRTAVSALASFLEEHRVRLRWGLTAELPSVEADAVLLGQVVRNIVMNAAQSMPEGGLLTIQSALPVHGSGLALHFHDTGTGIPPEELDRIFRPFVTTRPKGTGLGLPIVQKIVEQHGGHVEVQSRVGEGTSFMIWLPMRPAVETDVQTADSLASAGDLPAEFVRPEPPLIYNRDAGDFPDK